MSSSASTGPTSESCRRTDPPTATSGPDRRPGALPLSVTGRARVLAADLRARLGDSAWWVLQAFWAYRDPRRGESVVSAASIARGSATRQGMRTPGVVRTACARLRDAGLVVYLGRRMFGGRRLATRLIRGAPATGFLGASDWVQVPAETAVWARRLSGHGGARAGAGRKRRNQEVSISNQELSISNQELSISGIQEQPTRRSRSPRENLSDPAAQDARGSEPRVSDVALGGAGETPSDGRQLPLPPWLQLTRVLLPSPPLLEEEMGATERVLALVTAYRGAVASRFGARVGHAFRRGNITASKWFPLLRDSAATMLKHEIAPAAWVAWSIDVWRKHHSDSRPPPVAWVFAAKRIVERRGWFASEESSYMGGRVVNPPERTDVARRYQQAALAVARGGDPGEVIASLFPEGYERALADAQRAVDREKVAVRSAVDRGEFVW